MRTSPPERAHGVNEIGRGEAIATCDLRLPSLAPAEKTAFIKEFRPGGTVNGAVDATAAKQGGVCSIDYGPDPKCGDIGNDCSQDCHDVLATPDESS